MTDHLTPERIATGNAQATERYTAQLQQEREQRQQQRTYRSKAREVQRRWKGSREQQREARAYAEEWLQALRDWHVRGRTELVSSRNLYSSRPPSENPTMGQYSSSGGLTALTFRQMRTPLGWVSESCITALCSSDPLLQELQRGAGLATLHHASGRGWAGQRAREYGAALLRLAQGLGDSKATEMLDLVFAED